MSEAHKVDVAIVGAGPAGLSAAIYAQRAMLDAITIEHTAVGGQMVLTSDVDNYPGVPHTDGYSLVEAMQQQATDLGARIVMSNVRAIERTEDGTFLVQTDEEHYAAKTVILAGGATPRHAGFDGEELFVGKGVSYCATCDGMFFRNREVFVIGGGNSAAEEALFLAKFASKVTMVVRKDHLRAQAIVARQVEENPKVYVRYLTSITAVGGDSAITSVTFRDNNTGELTTEEFATGVGVFVFVGRDPASQLVRAYVDVDEVGYVVANERMETRTPGLFVAGDVRKKSLRQIVTAASDGAVAATSVAAYLGQPVEG
ncbi:MAG: thioredoxin-disulfide reductase [Coriobacteriales bacterium]|nr:thioredoxin-disulfide reductase [Coriobacteriales bacterium]